MTQSDTNPVLIDTAMPPQHPNLEQELEKIHQLIQQVLRIAVGAAIINVLIIVALTIFVNPLFAGKVVVIEVMFGLSALCIGVAVGQKKIMHLLMQAEAIAEFARDQAFVDLNMIRDELVRLRKKLTREVDDSGYTAVGELLKTVSPLVKMFIQKEKNIFRWGLFGWKVAQNAMAVIKQRSNSQ